MLRSHYENKAVAQLSDRMPRMSRLRSSLVHVAA